MLSAFCLQLLNLLQHNKAAIMALDPIHLVLLVIVCCMCGECYSKSDRYIKQTTFADRMFPADQVKFQIVKQSAISCGQQCSTMPGCAGVVYLQGNKTCFGIKPDNPLSAMSLPLPGAVLYIPIVGGMRLWFVTQLLTYKDARSACSPVGSLVKLDTASKLNAVKAYLLDTNNGYHQTSFWVQGRYRYDYLGMIGGAWQYTDGTPLLAGHWNPGAPDNIGADCVMLWHLAGFAFDDYWCDNPVGFICEYPN